MLGPPTRGADCTTDASTDVWGAQKIVSAALTLWEPLGGNPPLLRATTRVAVTGRDVERCGGLKCPVAATPRLNGCGFHEGRVARGAHAAGSCSTASLTGAASTGMRIPDAPLRDETSTTAWRASAVPVLTLAALYGRALYASAQTGAPLMGETEGERVAEVESERMHDEGDGDLPSNALDARFGARRLD